MGLTLNELAKSKDIPVCFSCTSLNELLKEYEKLGMLITTEDKSKYYPTSMEIIKPTNPENYLENDIEALKKRIKHSKNPMEKKRFEKQLNLAYKRRKLDKRGTSS